MSIKKQLFLAMIFISIFALIGSVFSSTYNSRLYLVEQLHQKNQDNANALAISLSQPENDFVKIKLAVSAQFDTGNYEKIWFKDNRGEIVVEKKSSEIINSAPDWFIHAILLEVPVGQSKVTAGWKQLGTIYLVSQKKYAYEALWKSTVDSFWISFLSIAIGLVLAEILINKIKNPIEQIVDHLKNIPEKKFIESPSTKVVELRGLYEAVSATSRQLKKVFEDEEKQLEALKQKLNYDELTGSMNRDFVLSKLKENLNDDEFKYNGCAIFRLLNLAEINQQKGRKYGDLLLKEMARALEGYVSTTKMGYVGRLSNTDFLAVFANEDLEHFVEFVKDGLLHELGIDYQEKEYLAIGVSDLCHGEQVGKVLSRVDIALAEAEIVGKNGLCFKYRKTFQEDHEYLNNVRDYFNLINQAFAEKSFKLSFYPLNSISGELVHFEAALQISMVGGVLLPASKFLPIAERMGVRERLDLIALELAIDALNNDANLTGVAVNLSHSVLLDSSLMAFVRKIMGKQKLLSRLSIDIPEFLVHQHPALISELTAYLHKLNVRVGIKHFRDCLNEITIIKSIGLDYIKVDRLLIRNLSKQDDAKVMVQGLVDLAHQVGLMLYAEGIETEAEIAHVKMLNFDGMVGKGIIGFNN